MPEREVIARRALLVLALVAGAARADWTSIGSPEFAIDDPPEAGSPADRRDFEELHRLQDTRDPEDCRVAGGQFYPSFEALYGSSSVLTEAEYDKAEPLLVRVFRLTERVSSYFKNRFQRPRPYNTDDTLEPCVRKPKGNKAYPSSHAAVGAAGACVLAKIFPAKAARLREYGAHLGELRAIVGVHHPTDVKAGQKLGADVCERLLSEQDFREELEAL